VSGSLALTADGLHSLVDAAANVIGIVGIGVARRPPDANHPYGHRKYETVAAAAVTIFLVIVVVEVLRNAFNHLTGRATPLEISNASFVVMVATVAPAFTPSSNSSARGSTPSTTTSTPGTSAA